MDIQYLFFVWGEDVFLYKHWHQIVSIQHSKVTCHHCHLQIASTWRITCHPCCAHSISKSSHKLQSDTPNSLMNHLSSSDFNLMDFLSQPNDKRLNIRFITLHERIRIETHPIHPVPWEVLRGPRLCRLRCLNALSISLHCCYGSTHGSIGCTGCSQWCTYLAV